MTQPDPGSAVLAAPPTDTQASRVERRVSRRRQALDAVAGRYRVVPVLLTLVLIWGFFFTQNSAFVSNRNITNLLLQIVVTATIALGIVFVLLLAEIDLSVAANSGASATLTAIVVVNHGWPAWVGIAAGIAAGGLIGLVVGAVVTQFGVPSFVVTLGMQLVLLGVILILLPGGTGQVSLFGTGIATLSDTYLPPALGWLAMAVGVATFVLLRFLALREAQQRGMPVSLARSVLLPGSVLALTGVVAIAVLNGYLGVPLPVVILFGLLAVLSYVTTQTPFGLHLYAVGANPDAARRAGIGVARTKMIVFTLAGALAALGGILAASRLLGVSASSGTGTLLLESIAAAVIGGTSLFGGRGSVWDALLGALVIGSISNGLDLIGAQTVVKFVTEGLILVLAATVDSVLTRGSVLARGSR